MPLSLWSTMELHPSRTQGTLGVQATIQPAHARRVDMRSRLRIGEHSVHIVESLGDCAKFSASVTSDREFDSKLCSRL